MIRDVMVGQRVTVLYRLADETLTEAVGYVVERTDADMLVRTKKRGDVLVAFDAIRAGRIIR